MMPHGSRKNESRADEGSNFEASEVHKQLRERIEEFAPDQTSNARNLFYPKLRKDLKEIAVPDFGSDSISPDAYSYALSLIYRGYLRFVSSKAQERTSERKDRTHSITKLSEEQEKIKRTLGKLNTNPNLRSLYWEFYDPTDVRCPHGRFRKECEALAKKRANLLRLDQPPLNVYIRCHLTEVKKNDAWLLQHRPSEFCEPSNMPSTPLPIIRGGRPKDELENFLLREMVGWLQAAGWRLTKAFSLLAKILRLFFGERSEVVNLRKRWYRLSPPATISRLSQSVRS